MLSLKLTKDINSNIGALCLLLRLLIDDNIVRTLAAIVSHLPHSDEVAGSECLYVCDEKNGRVNQAGYQQEAISR